jgi:hypothetical protein
MQIRLHSGIDKQGKMAHNRRVRHADAGRIA